MAPAGVQTIDVVFDTTNMAEGFYQANITSMKYLMPPYGKFADKVFNFLAKFKS